MSVDLNVLPRFRSLESIQVAGSWTDRTRFALFSLALTVFAQVFSAFLSANLLTPDDRSVETLESSNRGNHSSDNYWFVCLGESFSRAVPPSTVLFTILEAWPASWPS